MTTDTLDLPEYVRPRFDPENPPNDIGSNPARWDYWAVEPTGEAYDFTVGNEIGRECLADDDRNIARSMLSYMLATMRDKGRFSDVEAGLIAYLGRKALVGARPTDFEDATPSELVGVGRTQFQLGMADAIADIEYCRADWLTKLLPARIIDRIGRAVITQEYTPEFAGYATAIIAAAVACGEH